EPLTGDKQLLHAYSQLLASDTWIKEKPQTLKALLRALKRANDLLASDRPKALDALQKALRMEDREALKVMTDANRYTRAFDEAPAMAITATSEWAVDPKLVTWKAKR